MDSGLMNNELDEQRKKVRENHSKKNSERDVALAGSNFASDSQQLVVKQDSIIDEEGQLGHRTSTKGQSATYLNQPLTQPETSPAVAKDKFNMQQYKMQQQASFDPNQPFFSLEMAMKHRSATKVSLESVETGKGEILQYCPCCTTIVPTREDQIPFFGDSVVSMAHLGPAYVLYFQFMRYSMAFVAIIFVVSGGYNIYKNNEGDACEKDSACVSSIIMQLAQTNRTRESSPDQLGAVLNFIVAIFLILFATFFRIRQKQVEKNIDKSDVSTQDYTIFVNHIPLSKTRQDIQRFFEEKVPLAHVKKVTQSFRLKEYNVIVEKLQNSESTEEEKRKCKQELERYSKECQEEVNIEQKFTGAAFVSFEKEDQVVKVLEFFQIPFWNKVTFRGQKDTDKLFDNQQLQIQQAHEPGDTNWEKIEFSTKEKFIRRMITFLLTIGSLAGSFFAILGIANVQTDLNKDETTSKTTIQVFSFLASLATVGINQVFQFAIQIFADFESYNFKTDTVISIAQKSGLVQFVNTTVVQFSVSLIQNGDELAKEGGLVNTITLLMLTNTVLPQFLSLLQFDVIIKWLMQKWFLSKSDENKRKKTQMAINTLFERPQMNAAACFAAAANSLLLAAFYSWIIPIGLPLCIITLMLQLAINKLKLIKFQSMPIPLGSQLPAQMIDFYMEIIILIFSAGCLTFELILYNQTRGITIAQLSISALWFLVPVNKLIDYMFSSSSNFIETKTYEEAYEQGHFQSDYDRRNPILQTNAIAKYIEFLKGRQAQDAKELEVFQKKQEEERVQHEKMQELKRQQFQERLNASNAETDIKKSEKEKHQKGKKKDKEKQKKFEKQRDDDDDNNDDDDDNNENNSQKELKQKPKKFQPIQTNSKKVMPAPF